MVKKKLGDILVELKVLTPEQLLECLIEQKESGKLLGQVLLDRKLVNKNDLSRALALQLGIPL